MKKVFYKCLVNKKHNRFEEHKTSVATGNSRLIRNKFGNVVEIIDPTIYTTYYTCLECDTKYMRIESSNGDVAFAIESKKVKNI
jgi:hypothetical protein